MIEKIIEACLKNRFLVIAFFILIYCSDKKTWRLQTWDLLITFFNIICNTFIPLALFKKALRQNLVFLFVISIFVNIGMWLERFVIIVTSLSHEYVPYSHGNYTPSWVEGGITLGTFGFFFMMFLLFAKFLPVVAVTEKKEEIH